MNTSGSFQKETPRTKCSDFYIHAEKKKAVPPPKRGRGTLLFIHKKFFRVKNRITLCMLFVIAFSADDFEAAVYLL